MLKSCIYRSNQIFLKNNFSLKTTRITRSIITSSTNATENSSPLSSKNKYNKPPPIDLKSVRANTSDQQKNDDAKPNTFASILLLAVPVITFGLGVWQIKRRERKLELIDYLKTQSRSEPVELPTDIMDYTTFIKENEYKPFKVKGHFVHSKETLLTMRHDFTGSSHLPGGLVITPFVLSKDPSKLILINRGYVPYTHFSPTTRQHAQIDHEVELTGLLRSNEPESTFTPTNVPPNEWHYRDVDLLAKTLGTAPIFLDAVESTTIKGGPIGGQTNVQLRNDHLIYLVTWFSLSFITSILWWKRFSRAFF